MKRWHFFPCLLMITLTATSWATSPDQPTRTITAHVIAMDQPILVNRLGATDPGAIIYALREDVVSNDTPLDVDGNDMDPGRYTLKPGNVRLRSGKRPRPLVLRANKGDRLVITFTNCLTVNPSTELSDAGLSTSERQVGLDIAGLNVENIESLSSFTGTNPNSYAQPGDPDTIHVPESASAAPGETLVYTLFAAEEGAFFIYSHAGEGSHISAGLFGLCNVQPESAEWYRSQVTHNDLVQATLHLGDLASVNKELDPKTNRRGEQLTDAQGNLLWTLTTSDPDSSLTNEATVLLRNQRIYTQNGQPVINYQARYRAPHPRAGMPVLAMLNEDNHIVHSDLTAIITGPGAGRFPYSHNSPSFFENPASPDRRQPYREISIIYHMPTVVQSFVQFVDPAMVNAFTAGNDGFGINYGIAGIGPEIVANRLGVGPMGGEDSVDLKYEEFFLASWAVGDPAMVVDVPANAPNDVVSNPADGLQLNPNLVPVASDDIYQPLEETVDHRKATIAYYSDDPSNVYHSYMRDHVKFRIANAGAGQPHVHHQHAHQWLHTPNSDDSHYLDSQLVMPGSTYTLEMVYNGSGNRNQTVGDSIFHCHFYPHFARGMWSLWRVHDVFESGTIVEADGRVKWTDDEGNRIKNRALPDGEIVAGTPIPAMVPMPTLAMAPIPAQVELTADGRRSITIPDVYPNGFTEYRNPGYPFFIPGLAGSRAPHPPLDFAWAEDGEGNPKRYEEGAKKGRKVLLDGGLPRHLVFGGNVIREFHTRWDFTKDFILYDDEDKTNKDRMAIAGGMFAFELPEEGTAVEQAAMRAHSIRAHASFLPNGDPGNFILNGLPPIHGAPYADPSVDDDGDSIWNVRRYQGANIQLDVVFNKSGWHFPQQRIISLWKDVASTISGERPPEPLFFRSNTGDTIEYWHTNLVPNYYEMDDFQVRTPTDILGQHIHLVKFDVTSSDGAGNGFNYEDGTFSCDEVRERIDAANLVGGLYAYDPQTLFANPDRQFNLKVQPYEEFYPFFGPEPDGQNWDGAQTTIQRWDTDPLLNDLGEDRTLRTVFTHDHFGPSTHQQAGLYAGLVVEPEESTWWTNGPSWGGDNSGSTVHIPANTRMNTRSDGGPTSWQAIIVAGDEAEKSYREFLLEFQDTALTYGPDSTTTEGRPTTPVFTIPTFNDKGSATGVGLTNTWSPDQTAVNQIIAALKQDPPIISSQLSEQFSRNGITLSDNVTISVVVNNDVPPDTDYLISDPLVTDTTNSSDIDVDEQYQLSITTFTDPDTSDLINGIEVVTLTMTEGWADASNVINGNNDKNHPNAAPFPQLISSGNQGTQITNYRNEPSPLRVATNSNPPADANANATDLAYQYTSIVRQDPALNEQPDDGRTISAGSTFTYPNHPIVPTGNTVGDVQDTDPYTPLLRAYEGDNVQVRTLVGAHVNPHAFSIHGNKWLFEPSYEDSGYRNVQHMGISEHFEMLFQLPASDNDHYSGAPFDGAFSDYLWQSNGSYTGSINGMWGILRAYDGDKVSIDSLPKLPNNTSGTAPAFAWDTVASTFSGSSDTWPANYRSFTVNATMQTVTYNDRGQTETNFPFSAYADSNIEQTNGLLYLLQQETTNAGTTSYDYEGAPLIMRVAAGDFIEVIVTNDLNPSNSFFTSNVAASAPFGTGGGAPSVDMTVSPTVGINAQMIAYDVSSSDGTNVGFNQYQTAAPSGGVVRYYWYAGNLVQQDGEIVPEPVEFGTVSLNPADPLLQPIPGLIGALVVEPEGSIWEVDQGQPDSATVMDAEGNFLFRDFVAIYQELPQKSNQCIASFNNQGDSSSQSMLIAAYNYKGEPQCYRIAGSTDGADNYSNSIVGGEDPQIPIFRVPAGQAFRIRHTFQSGDCPNVFVLEGHGWQEEPYTDDGRVIGYNQSSQFLGSQQFFGNDQFNFVFDSAGGPFGVVGDYEMNPILQDSLGGWALVRVEPQTVTVERVASERGVLEVSGRVIGNGQLPNAVDVDINTNTGMLTTRIPVDQKSGRYTKLIRDDRLQVGDKVTISTTSGARVETQVRERSEEVVEPPETESLDN